MHSEVVIIGGGVIGLSIARELHKRGVAEITVLERGECAREASWAAGGMLSPQVEAENDDPFFRFCSASRDMYPDFAAELLSETDVDIELDRRGSLYAAFDGEATTKLERLYARQRAFGWKVEQWDAAQVRKAEPFISPNVLGALYFPEDWQVENRRLCAALKNYAITNGIDIREHTAVHGLAVEKQTVTGAETSNGTVAGSRFIIATGAWTSLLNVGTEKLPLNVTPVKGQILTFHTARRVFERVIYSLDGYLIPRSDGRILAGATSEHAGYEKELTKGAEAMLVQMARQIAPSVASLSVHEHAAGFRPFVADGLPVIGPIDGYSNVTIATGHYRNGILLAPITGKVVAEQVIYENISEESRPFLPERLKIRGLSAV